MTIRVGINGFGRIGRLAARAFWSTVMDTSGSANPVKIVHINEINGNVETAAHLLQFDSVHGRSALKIKARDGALNIENEELTYSCYHDPAESDWKDLDLDLIIEASGQFKSAEDLQPYFDSGIKKVVVACPVKNGNALNIVMGVNDHLYDPKKHHLVTAASCTTNSLAPIIKVLHSKIGIEHGLITTIHDVTNTQTVVDGYHKDLRRARSSLVNLIPTSTGSASAIGLIFPELDGKLNGIAVRVPLLNASLTDCVFEMRRPTTIGEVNNLFKSASQSDFGRILGYEERPLVSTDYAGDIRSCIVDGLSTMVVDNTQLKILAWYDNEMGYAHRLIELVNKVAFGIKS
ncbi:ArsJ-associated glyceraldehyde-3-phosphate dehydrogenase [Alphaproteobacteria bacterium]|nr:ArsJ-associated glyceraldehyde-3-phosphate dehydrogenase [Alphaproteobacteria bacterium]